MKEDDFRDVVAMMELRGWRDHFVIIFTGCHSKGDLLAMGRDKRRKLVAQKDFDEATGGPKHVDGNAKKFHEFKDEQSFGNGEGLAGTIEATSTPIQTLTSTL